MAIRVLPCPFLKLVGAATSHHALGNTRSYPTSTRGTDFVVSWTTVGFGRSADRPEGAWRGGGLSGAWYGDANWSACAFAYLASGAVDAVTVSWGEATGRYMTMSGRDFRKAALGARPDEQCGAAA